jgi:hypothetical protein
MDGTPIYGVGAYFRGLNAVTRVPIFCKTLAQEDTDRLNGNRYLTFVDLNDAYFHVRIRPIDKHKTGTVTPVGTYHYECLAFGLAACLFTLTRIKDEVLFGLRNIPCLVFMDSSPSPMQPKTVYSLCFISKCH